MHLGSYHSNSYIYGLSQEFQLKTRKCPNPPQELRTCSATTTICNSTNEVTWKQNNSNSWTDFNDIFRRDQRSKSQWVLIFGCLGSDDQQSRLTTQTQSVYYWHISCLNTIEKGHASLSHDGHFSFLCYYMVWKNIFSGLLIYLSFGKNCLLILRSREIKHHRICC